MAKVWVRDDNGTAGYEHKGSTILGKLCDVSSGPIRIDPFGSPCCDALAG